MTRPSIVRADTLDLQNQEAPSAKDHSKANAQLTDFGDNLIGTHQASEVRHVIEERHTEEQNLQHAWSDGGSSVPQQETSGQQNGPQDESRTDESDPESASDDDMMDRISSSPSISDEDIDFDFVYALHTFVATVEGQANATKGDTMVLLDDSNSYWWLVRVVKDSSIGYLPAEHIETPTERLARLNKHRNVDLSAAMLGDNADRPKNPLKKAMKRRNAKTVQFAAPTYVEASDYEYSSEEDEQLPDAATNGSNTNRQIDDQTTQQMQQQSQQMAKSEGNSTSSVAASRGRDSPTTETAPLDEPQGSPKLVDKTEAAPLKSRKGTPRNADSFLKDDGAETRKISLTPSILRDESSSTRSTDTRDGSFDSLEKTTSPTDKPKEEKKKKEKKQGMLSGLFKGKKKDKKDEKADKTKKRDLVRDEEVERTTSEPIKQSTSPGSDPAALDREAVERKLSARKNKLLKTNSAQNAKTPTSSQPTSFVAELEGSQVAFEAPTGLEDEIRPATPQSSTTKTKKVKAKKAKQREALDDFDGPEADDIEEPAAIREEASAPTFMHGTESIHIPTLPGSFESSEEEEDEDEDEEGAQDDDSSPTSLTEPQAQNTERPEDRETPAEEHTDKDITPTPSEAQISPPHTGSTPTIPSVSRTPPPEEDSSPESRRQDSRASTATPSRTHLSPSPASTSTTWSDAGLRAWLDGDNDIRDMLVVIHDQSDVQPVGKSHPLLAGLFVEETKTLKGLSDELDGLLGGVLKRRSNAITASS